MPLRSGDDTRRCHAAGEAVCSRGAADDSSFSGRGDHPPPGTRDRIVAAAEDLIARHGVEGLQVKEVAARVGIRPPSVFAHFGGRDVVERLLRRFEALFDAPAEGTPEEEVRARTRRLVLFLIDNPADARIVLREWAQAGAPDVERHDLGPRLLAKHGGVLSVARN